MQCQHTATTTDGAPRVCPNLATKVQIVRYDLGDVHMPQTYYWCNTHAADHATVPNGTVLTPDADGMVTIA